MRRFTKYPSNYICADTEPVRRRDLFGPGVPLSIQKKTMDYMQAWHMGLADAFKEACRNYAERGSELREAFDADDFRKFIPSAYCEEYLDFNKYPLGY